MFMNAIPGQGPILRADGTSLHRQLFLVLRDQINAGVHPLGAALPKEEALCEHFGVSRITVRRALADLEAQGFVQRRQGRGTLVRMDAPVTPPSAGLSFIDSLRQTTRETRAEVLFVRTEPVPATVAALLQLGPDASAVHTLRLRKSGDTPLMLTDAWIPADLGKKVTAAALKRKPLYQILLGQGIRFGRVVQEISAEAADPWRASLLQTAVSAPLIRLTRLIRDVGNRPVQHLTIHVSPERSRVLMDISSDQTDTLSAGHIAHDPKYLAPRG